MTILQAIDSVKNLYFKCRYTSINIVFLRNITACYSVLTLLAWNATEATDDGLHRDMKQEIPC